MTAARRLAFVAVFVSAAWSTVPRLAEEVRRAYELRPLAREARRVRMFGPSFEAMRRIDRSLPPGERIGLVSERSAPADEALFFAYYAFPRRANLYFGLDQVRMDQNAPRHLVRLGGSPVEPRLMTYADMRAEQIAGRPVVRRPEPSGEAMRQFVIPLVSSGDGPSPDVYTTEAVLQNRGEAPAHISFRMFPAGHAAGIVLAPGVRRTWTDFVYEAFGTMETGWLVVEADQPIAARFWFVNRGRNDADVLEPARWFRQTRLIVPPGGRMWVINPHDRELPVSLSGGEHRLAPRTHVPLVWVGEARLAAADDWFAFVSWRDEKGDTHFIWPEAE